MQYITTTELRTKSSELIESLRKGTSISLIHRSKIVGVIKPQQEAAKPFNAEEFKKLLDSLKPKKLIPKADRDKVYRENLTKRYG